MSKNKKNKHVKYIFIIKDSHVINGKFKITTTDDIKQ